MNPELWRQIEHHYLDLVDRPPEERQKYLGQCDPQVREEVEKMLDQPTGDFLLSLRLSGADVTETVATTLKPGFRLGPYRVDALLGTGGMGSVYRGVDTRLDRPVAIKVCKEQFSSRFEREAKTIAALNHPHICTLFDVGPNFLVMELIEGESLFQTLASGSLPRDAVVNYGIQLSSALSAAHVKGIVHRDLKPQNIMLVSSGAPFAKLLDFGIAKEFAPADSKQFATETGVRIGTPAYMAPEQLEGRAVDARSDIYSLGLVLSEMSRDRRTGKAHPIDPSLSAVIEKCLRRDPSARWQSAADLKTALSATASSPSPIEITRRKALWIPFGIAAPLLAAGGWWLNSRSRSDRASPRVAPIHVAITLPRNAAGADPGRLQGPPVVSPDGSAIVISLMNESGEAIYRRPLDSDQLTIIEGTEGGTFPFWSPDSREVCYFADGKLKRVSATGGNTVTLCSAVDPRGGAWSSHGTIIFGLNRKGLFRIADTGGSVQPLTTLDVAAGENSHRYPVFLADDGRRFFYFARTDRLED